MSDNITAAIELLRANGYRVTKPRAKPTTKRNGLNAIGKPYGPNFDPNYRMRYRTPRLRTGGQSVTGWPTGEAGKEAWLRACINAEREAVKARRMTRDECRFYTPAAQAMELAA